MAEKSQDSMYKMLDNQLRAIKAVQSACLKIIVDQSNPRVVDGKVIPPVLTEEYWGAVNQLKVMMSNESDLVKRMNKIDPDLDFKPDDTYSFDDRGCLKVL